MKNTLVILTLMVLAGCSTYYDEEMDQSAEVIYPEGFDYATTSASTLTVEVKDNNDIGLNAVPFEVYTIYDGTKELLATGQSVSGFFQLDMVLGNHIDSLSIETTYLGIPHITQLEATAQMNVALGGVSSYVPTDEVSNSNSGRTTADGYTFMGSYDANGVPYYMEPVNDYISQDLLDLVNNTLPERFPVPTYNPQYIVDSVSSDTKLKDSAEVWVTFVHEGAGWRNALGYYQYDLSNPPASVDDIENLNIIFPNASYVGHGGGLESGNKVYLGNFAPNTSIGWFLVPNAWSGSGVNSSNQIKYSNKDFNTFTSEAYRTHTVLLKDDAREILLLGMEDTSRPGGDNDFNDAVFYVTASPYSAIITTDLEETQTEVAPDTDGDGVIDRNDNYPEDANKAFDIYTPDENTYGSIAYEDLYPSKGDFDMNDMVVDYNFHTVSNVANRIVELNASFRLRALGAAIHSGFGFTLPVDPSKISSITGQDIELNDQLALNTNGTEAGQSNAVILVFEDGFRTWQQAFGQTNTIPEYDYITPLDFDITVTFTEPISSNELGNVPYDPFIFYTEDRSVEVHFTTGTPTDKADLNFLYGDDRAEGSNFLTYDNLPYAINLPVSFDYPEEGESMSETFIHFDTWAQSLNTSYTDWYMSNGGYRDASKIYSKD